MDSTARDLYLSILTTCQLSCDHLCREDHSKHQTQIMCLIELMCLGCFVVTCSDFILFHQTHLGATSAKLCDAHVNHDSNDSGPVNVHDDYD